MTAKKILIVEDEKHNLIILERILTSQGYDITAVTNGEDALALVEPEAFDVAILDLNLGYGISGMEVLSHFRQHAPDTSILLLTGNGTLETAVEALRQGAHDYLLKPARSKDIQASIQRGLEKRQKQLEQRKREAVLSQLEQSLEESLNRLRSTAVGSTAVQPDEAETQTGRYLVQGNIEVDLPRHRITINGRPLDLSLTEYALLVYLIAQAPRIIPPQELVRQIQGYAVEQDEASAVTRTHIYRLRQKIKVITPQKQIIRTVRGVGYTVDI
jgi:DNA-binding response OmpR family regulator